MAKGPAGADGADEVVELEEGDRSRRGVRSRGAWPAPDDVSPVATATLVDPGEAAPAALPRVATATLPT